MLALALAAVGSLERMHVDSGVTESKASSACV